MAAQPGLYQTWSKTQIVVFYAAAHFVLQLIGIYASNHVRVVASFCGTHANPKSILTENNKLVVEFVSDDRFNDKGFNMTYREAECEYIIRISKFKTIKLKCKTFDLSSWRSASNESTHSLWFEAKLEQWIVGTL